jgi:hypothetical protein
VTLTYTPAQALLKFKELGVAGPRQDQPTRSDCERITTCLKNHSVHVITHDHLRRTHCEGEKIEKYNEIIIM